MVDVFTATVDCASITYQERVVTFRRAAGGRFISDYYRLSVVASGGLDGSAPITATVTHGAAGAAITKELMLTNGQWQAADGTLAMVITTSSSDDGVQGISASVTSSSLGLTGFVIQAATNSTQTEYSSENLTTADPANDPSGSLHAQYPDVEWQDDTEHFQAPALEVEGPSELLNKPEFRVQIRSGERKAVSRDGKFFLADETGEVRDTMVLLPRAESPVAHGTDFFGSIEEEVISSGEFVAGFVVGFLGGGCDMVSATGKFIGNTFVHVGASLWWWFPNTESGRFARRLQPIKDATNKGCNQ